MQNLFAMGASMSHDTITGGFAPCNRHLGLPCPVIVKGLMKTHRVRVVTDPKNVRYVNNQMLL